MTSPNGKTWTQTALISYANLYDVCWAAELGLFCAVGGNSTTGRGVIYTSPDTATWTSRTYPWFGTAGDNGITGICWSSTLGLLVAAGANSSSGNNVATSSDGVNWTGRSISHTTLAPRIAWVDGLNNFILYDTAGSNYDLSKDGATWARYGGVIASPNGVAWCPEIGRLVFVTTTGINRFRVTRDPSTGSQGFSQANYSTIRGILLSYRAVAYAPELNRLVAVSATGTGNRVATSP